MIYTSGKLVNASILDSKSELSIIGAFQLVQDNITDLMGVLHIDGIVTKRDYNAMWVVVKNRVRILHRPFWNDGISVQSFVSFKSLVKICIDTRIVDEAGNVLVYSRAELCALDCTTGRIRKMDSVNVGDNIVVEPSDMDIEFAKFNDDIGLLVDSVQVRSTNIDYLHHCNNIEYLRFILNTYPESALHSIGEIEVLYANQSFEGDNLSVYKLDGPNMDKVYIKRNNDYVIKCEIIKE